MWIKMMLVVMRLLIITINNSFVKYVYVFNIFLSCTESLQQDFEAVEEELDQLENVCEEQTMEKEKASHLAQLGAYRKAKESECLAVKGVQIIIIKIIFASKEISSSGERGHVM